MVNTKYNLPHLHLISLNFKNDGAELTIDISFSLRSRKTRVPSGKVEVTTSEVLRSISWICSVYHSNI